ncbi:MAG: site-2 protease family protein [Patescibacteria group bacterium]|nr:site-2 protease family protein [Patescibacteria group bacterium]MBU2509403.1 site-2 protease family protein [Patescibacteria group bacterium]
MLGLLFQEPILFVVWILAILVALTIHEFSHAWAGTILGDNTAKRMGRFTLNPLSHIDPVGLLILITIGFGWGKPVPFNPYNLRKKKWGPALVALAGPAMNLVGALILGLILRIIFPFLGPGNLLIQFLSLSVFLNVALLLFNLIPLPPLDGSKLLLVILSDHKYEHIRTFLENRGPLILLGLIFGDMILNLNIFGGLFSIIMGLASLIVGFGM